MESRSKVKETVKAILLDHGITDKDKLENIPEVITGYIGGVLIEALMDFSAELTDGTVSVFVTEKWGEDGRQSDSAT